MSDTFSGVFLLLLIFVLVIVLAWVLIPWDEIISDIQFTDPKPIPFPTRLPFPGQVRFPAEYWPEGAPDIPGATWIPPSTPPGP